MSYRIKKRFGPYPAAHRQHDHDGHCRFIHGHNWYVVLMFAADKLDADGFVLDFGKFSAINNMFKEMLDHTLLLSKKDPAADKIGVALHNEGLAKVRFMDTDSCSAEHMASYIYSEVYDWLQRTRPGSVRQCGVKLVAVTIQEDDNNSASFGYEA